MLRLTVSSDAIGWCDSVCEARCRRRGGEQRTLWRNAQARQSMYPVGHSRGPICDLTLRSVDA
jgi:hypothetical protein